MLPLQYQCMRTDVLRNARMVALSSGTKFGDIDLHEEHLIEKLNNYIGNLSNDEPHRISNKIRSVDFPLLDREPVKGRSGSSDILFGGRDVFRQDHGIEERFRKGLVGIADLRTLADPATRMHLSGSRGTERDLIRYFNRLDGEAFNRMTVRPMIHPTSI